MRRKASGSFLKKRTKKLLFCWALGAGGANAQAKPSKSFFASFCSQKEVLLFKAFS
jgi:hypothetical protein